jgi:toxin ParE1/3/4
VTHRIIVTPAAEADLAAIAAWIAGQADVTTALSYVDRVQARIMRLRDFPKRGKARPEFGNGMRSLSFERRLLILYRIDEDGVRIVRIVGAARDLSSKTL